MESISVSEDGEISINNERKFPMANLQAHSSSKEIRFKQKIDRKEKKGFIKNINLAICSEMSTSVPVKKLDTEALSVSETKPRIVTKKILRGNQKLNINNRTDLINGHEKNNTLRMVTRGRATKEDKAKE